MYVDGDGLCLLILFCIMIFITGVAIGATGMQKKFEE